MKHNTNDNRNNQIRQIRKKNRVNPPPTPSGGGVLGDPKVGEPAGNLFSRPWLLWGGVLPGGGGPPGGGDSRTQPGVSESRGVRGYPSGEGTQGNQK